MFTITHSSCFVICVQFCVALISCGCGSLSKQMDDGVMNAQTCANYSTMLGVVGTPGVLPYPADTEESHTACVQATQIQRICNQQSTTDTPTSTAWQS